jgi:hypothetical protein
LFNQSAQPQTLQKADLISHQYSAVFTGRDTAIVLPHRFLIPHTEKVFMDSLSLRPDADYRIDPLRGILRFSSPPDSGRRILVLYQSLPLSIPLEARHRTPSDSIQAGAAPAGARAATPEAAPKSKEVDYSEDLQKSGSIFRGISLGTDQGMRLQSGLRLQVSGRVAPNVEVVASLTDQNTPIQPEGNTQTLQEIDKVFVNVKAPGLSATLGDFVFAAPSSQFADYSRKLQGAMGRAEADFGSVTVFAAASKGQFTSNHFNGQEGNQGPYQLTGAQGQREIIVLAGTEKVWIDGEPMARGEDNDYTIEYGTGQVTFTRKRMVTADSRITVDFEYSDQKFQKGIYGAVGEGRFWKDRLRVRTSLFSESDDKDNPLDVPITDAYRRILQNAGDHPDSAVTTGALLAGPGKGSYDQVDTLGRTLYLYKGSGRGDYLVHFSYVGQGKGDYSFQGYDIFRYEGSGLGAYLPIVFLPLATSHQVADAAASIEFARGVSAGGEMGVSAFDQNTYSGKDDGNNTGTAYAGQFAVDRRPLRILNRGFGEFGLRGTYRNTDDSFRPLGRTVEVEHGRKWGTAEGSPWGETVSEFQGIYAPFSSLSLNGGYGLFRQGAFRSERREIGTALANPKLPSFQYGAELIETRNGPGLDGYWLRQNGSLGAKWKSLHPSLSYEGEHRRDQSPDSAATGFRFDEWAGKMAFERKAFRIEFEERLRDDRIYKTGKLENNSLAGTQNVRLDAGSGSPLSTSLIYSHRVRDYRDPDVQDQKTDLAEARLGLSHFKHSLDVGVNYRFSSTQVSEMARDTIRVGAGQGNYRYDESLKEFVPDPDGDVLFRTIQTGRFLPVNDLEAELDARFDAARIWSKAPGIKGVIGRFQTRSLFRVERRDKERSFGLVNARALRPDWGRDSSLVQGLLAFTQDVEYNAPGGGLSVRLRLRSDDSESHQLVQEGLLRKVRAGNLRIKCSPSNLFGVLAEYENQNESKRYSERSLSDRDIRLNTATIELSFRPKQDVEFALKTRARITTDVQPDPDTRAVSVSLFPRFTYSLKTRGQLRSELEIGNVKAEPSGRTLPYEMLAGDQPGRTVRFNALMSYRVSGHVTATLSYRARKEPWRKSTYHTGQVEVRAFF